MGGMTRRRPWILGVAVLAAVGVFVAVRFAGGPTPDPAADSRCLVRRPIGGEAPEALATDPARASGARPATLDASGTSLPAPGVPTPTVPEAAPPAAPATDLRGLVVDEAGRPVSRAQVRARDRVESETALQGTPLPLLATSDVDGRFAVPPVPPRGATVVSVAAPGLTLSGSEAYLETGVENRIVMVKACSLRARVVEVGSGAPVTDALVHAITGRMVSAAWGSLLDAPAAEVVRTDATGRATLATEGGPAILIVRSKEHAPVVTSGLTVPVGGLDVEVRATRGGALAVSVRGPDGALLAGARIQCEVRPAYRSFGATGPDGVFRFGGLDLPPVVPDPDSDVVPTLLVSAPGLETRILTFPLPAAGATYVQEIRLRIARMIRGHVRTADGAPAPGVRVRAGLDGGVGSDVSDPRWAVSDADGGFALGPIAVGLWSVYATRGDGTVLAGVDVTVSEDGEPPPAEVALPSTEGRLTVRVVDAQGRGVADTGLEVRATRHRYRLGVADGVTDATGVARLDQLAPEAAVLIVRPPASVPVGRDLTAADFDGRELRIALEDGSLEGRVVGLDQRPRRAHVKLCAQVGVCIEAGPTVECDLGGGFAFTGLVPGTYRLMVDEADGVLVGGDAMLRVGAPPVTLMVVSPAEAARLHVELRLVDVATGTPVHVPAFRAKVVLVSRVDAKELHAPHGPDDSEGRFLSFQSLPPGTYDGRLVVPGYEEVDLGAVTLPAEGEARTLRLERSGAVGK